MKKQTLRIICKRHTVYLQNTDISTSAPISSRFVFSEGKISWSYVEADSIPATPEDFKVLQKVIRKHNPNTAKRGILWPLSLIASVVICCATAVTLVVPPPTSQNQASAVTEQAEETNYPFSSQG